MGASVLSSCKQGHAPVILDSCWQTQVASKQTDEVTAYLNAHISIDKEVYVRLPEICGDDGALVRQLYKAMYGHPKAGKLWNRVVIKFLIGKGSSSHHQISVFSFIFVSLFFLFCMWMI